MKAVIEWHAERDEDGRLYGPNIDCGTVLITTVKGEVYVESLIEIHDETGWHVAFATTDPEDVLAWAELPKPYKPPKPMDMHPDAVFARKYMAGDPETVKKAHLFD